MSAEPCDRSLNADTVAANEGACTKESWASHPAAAVVQATVGRSVLIVLSDGRELQGTCTCFDWLAEAKKVRELVAKHATEKVNK